MDPRPTPDAFTGWLRLAAGPWRPVCSSPSRDGCWARLLAAPAPGPRAERMVLPAGRRPGEGPR